MVEASADSTWDAVWLLVMSHVPLDRGHVASLCVYLRDTGCYQQIRTFPTCDTHLVPRILVSPASYEGADGRVLDGVTTGNHQLFTASKESLLVWRRGGPVGRGAGSGGCRPLLPGAEKYLQKVDFIRISMYGVPCGHV